MELHKPARRVGLALVTLIGFASGQTITVDLATDDFDVPWPNATLADLPGPDGRVSFPEALLVSDNTSGQQTIAFAIPAADWWLPQLNPGICKLQNAVSWVAKDSVTIDGTTQTSFTGDTNPDGAEVSLDGLQLYLSGDGSLLTGFHDSRIEVLGSNCIVHDNTGGMQINVSFGSGSVIQDNWAWTIEIDRASGNLILGNTTSRVRVVGNALGGQSATNNRIGGPSPADRNFITGYGSYDSAGRPNGSTVELFDTIGTLVENNYIGTLDGMTQGSVASTIGIHVLGDNQDLTVRDNLISGILGHGTWPHHFGKFFGWSVFIEGTGSGIDLIGNRIGVDVDGQPLLGAVTSIEIGTFNYFGVSNVRIGDSNGDGNVIAGHKGTAVIVGKGPQQPADGVRISGNSIHDNGGLGIDLTPNSWTLGVTPNDPLDADAGGNGLQNYPVLAAAHVEGASLRVAGALHSSPAGTFTVELFASSACDPSGFGEGGQFLGATSVTTDGAGNASFDVVLAAIVDPSWMITSTATREPIGATSEFSACVSISEVCQANVGLGGPGDAKLELCGQTLETGNVATLELNDVAPSTPLLFLLSTHMNPTPFLGGVLVPIPALVAVAWVADATGGFSTPVPGGGGPATIYLQAIAADPTQPLGVELSNALEIVLGP